MSNLTIHKLICRKIDWTLLIGGSWMVSMTGNFLKKSIVYQATVTTEDSKSDETYVGLTENNFKTRFANNKASFNNLSKRMSTELSKHVWNRKDNNTNFQITYKILKHCIAYKPPSKRCNLCLREKYFIIWKPHLRTLNKRHQLVSSCRHTVKFMLQISSPLLLHNRIFGNGIVSIVTAF